MQGGWHIKGPSTENAGQRNTLNSAYPSILDVHRALISLLRRMLCSQQLLHPSNVGVDFRSSLRRSLLKPVAAHSLIP